MGADIYTDENWAWLASGRWATTPALRQLLADVASGRDQVSVAELPDLVGASMWIRIRTMAELKPHGKVRPQASPVRWLKDDGPVEERLFAPHQCSECSSTAIIPTRVPEISTDLLCGCGAMVNGHLVGAPAGLRFPDEYLQLQIPAQEALAEVRDRYTSVDSLAPRAVAVLLQEDLLNAGATYRELARATANPPTSSGAAFDRLTELRQLGLIVNDEGRPALWTYTDRGRKTAAALRARGLR